MTNQTASITLACPLDKHTLELDPATYATKACPKCGHGLVLAGGKREGNILWYYYFKIRCKDCGHVHQPTRDMYTVSQACPGCQREIWRRSLRPEDYAPLR